MRILGIDPGLSITGYGIVEVSPPTLKCIKYGGIRADSNASFPEKLLAINEKISQVIQEFSPDYCAVENIFYHQNKKTAIIMGHARAAAIVAAAKENIAVYEYSPREVKMSIVGFGAASKKQVQAMVQKILVMSEKPTPEDAADALAVALCLNNRLKFEQIKKST